MPIRASEKDRYPKDWPAISHGARDRAGWCCEFCGVKQGALGAWVKGQWRDALPKGTGARDNPRRGELFPIEGEQWWRKVVQVVLTVAHLDHTPENCAPENLKALCQRCHLVYDSKHHQKNAAATRRAKLNNGDLFPS